MSHKPVKNMEEFAAICGVSRPTVSKYFNDPDSVRKSTRAQIEAAIEKYNYRPNIFAMNQNRQHTRSVGIVVPNLIDPVFGELAQNIEQRCREVGFQPILLSGYGERELEVEALNRLRAMRPSGALVSPIGRDSDVEVLEDFCKDIPTVLFDRNIEGVGKAFVGSDNQSFVNQSVEYLLRSANPPMFFEMKNPRNPNSMARRLFYIESMESHGLEPKFYQIDSEGWAHESLGYQGGMRMLAGGLGDVDTILCSNDRLAFGLLAACYEMGVSVGHDKSCQLRIASHDDHPFSRYTCPSLTTVGHDYQLLSDCAVETLFDVIEKGGQVNERREYVFPSRLIIRDTA